MKSIITVFFALCMAAGAEAAPMSAPGSVSYNEPGQEITYGEKQFIRVTTPFQLALAISSGKNVIVAKDTVLDLTPLLYYAEWWEGRDGFKWLPYYNNEEFPGPTIVSEEVMDGRQLVIVGCKNIEIIGEGNSAIVLDPRHAHCLKLVDCENITLRNLDIHHTAGHPCKQAVIGITGGKGISIHGCNLRGSAIGGLELMNTSGFSMTGSGIHDCKGGILFLSNVDSARFEGCRFYRNWDTPLVKAVNSGMDFINCRFYDNAPLSSLFTTDREFGIADSYILHPAESLGDIGMARQIGNRFCDSPAAGETSSGPSAAGKIKVSFKGETPAVTDFISAIIPAANRDESGCHSWVKGWKRWSSTGKAARGEHYLVDNANGYACIEKRTADGTRLSFHDFRFWNCPGDKRILFAHSSGTLDRGQAIDTECSGLTFYAYDVDSRMLSYLGTERQLLESLPSLEREVIACRLPSKGQDIIFTDNNGENGTLRWFADGFEEQTIIDIR